jgi:hypothetical protein
MVAGRHRLQHPVTPGVLSPASSSADFTCAEATSMRWSSGAAGWRPRTVSGSRRPGLAAKSAPSLVSGAITRFIGRRDRLASPMKVAVIGWVAARPISSRAEVPLLPMSSACGRLEQRAGADAVHDPRVALGLDPRAERAHRRGGGLTSPPRDRP